VNSVFWEKAGKMATSLLKATAYQTVLQVETPVCHLFSAFAGNLFRQ
jgi:hypothetical protein